MDIKIANIQTIAAQWLKNNHVSLDVLRLDKIHPVVSGNKWFKLQHYIAEAIKLQKEVVTFGGAWSNHIVATAFYCMQKSVPCTGIIRGEKPNQLSATLLAATDYGMKLEFVSRSAYQSIKTHYKNASSPSYPSDANTEAENNVDNIILADSSNYYIPEGGYGTKGAKGAAGIAQLYNPNDYTHVIAAVGTGTMLAGIINSSQSPNTVIGISAMKGNDALRNEVELLLDKTRDIPQYTIINDYHFGGFGKHSTQLIEFMNEIYKQHELPLDFVYTAKTFYGIQDLIKRNFFPDSSRILMIHSGGLQGNCSIADKLIF